MREVFLRPLDIRDLPLLLAWSHIEEIWKYLPTSRKEEILTWEDHFKWWLSREDRIDWIIMVQTEGYGSRPVGVVTVNLKSLEVGIYVGEVTLWGKGVAKRALKLVLDRLAKVGRQSVWSVVHPENKRSQRLFEGLGFKKTGIGRRGQDKYERSLD